MFRILLLCFALLLSSIAPAAEAEAARISPYAKAKMKGRIYTHRPNYKRYKGYKFSKKQRSRKSSNSKTYRAPARTTHTTKRF